jgi:hypothetical protein
LEIERGKCQKARNGQEILWNTIIFVDSRKWWKAAGKILQTSGTCDQYLQSTASIKFASKKCGTQPESLTLNIHRYGTEQIESGKARINDVENR